MANFPPPTYQTVTGTAPPTDQRRLPEREYVTIRCGTNRGGAFSSYQLKVFGEDSVLDELAPLVQKMLPHSQLKRKPEDHCIKCEMGSQAVEYWHIQLMKLMASRGFFLKVSNTHSTSNQVIPTVSYTFAR